MKTGITITIVALGLALFAAPDAYGATGLDVDQRLSGSTFVIDVDEETGDTTSQQNVLAKGQPGTAQVHSLLVFGPPLGFDARCPAEFPFGSDLISFNWVETYQDGSLLTGSASPGQAVCSDGAVFAAQVGGIITGGTGRFEGATGTWEVDASTPPENSGLTGTFAADLD